MATFAEKTNNAKTVLTAGISAVASSMTVSGVSLFPSSYYYYVTIWDKTDFPDPGDDPGMEIVKVTSGSGTTLNITRAQDGTAASAHEANDAVELLMIRALCDEWEAAINSHTHVAGDGGVISHANLSNLSYAAAGHTGFEPTVTKGNLTASSPLSFSQARQVIGGATALSIADAAADGATKGAATFNATNFTAAAGVVNTIQNIATTSTPQFGKLGLAGAAGTAVLTFAADTVAAGGISFGGDVNVYRTAAGFLSTNAMFTSYSGGGLRYYVDADNSISIGGAKGSLQKTCDTPAGDFFSSYGSTGGVIESYPRMQVKGTGLLTWGSGAAAIDTNLYRSAANVLKTDDTFVALELRASSDVGGAASHNSLTNASNVAANSTGVGTIKMKGTTSRDSDGFLKVYIGTTAYWIPVFSAITG